MIPKVIKTERDYERALARISDIMDADQGTPEGDQLKLLVNLVEVYEKSKYPIDLPGSGYKKVHRVFSNNRPVYLGGPSKKFSGMIVES